ncbi:MAG: glycosyltransferase family 39 protein [Candidatus Eisenbacteria bacterium]
MKTDRVLLLAFLLALAVRIAVIDRPIWYDESCTYWEARPEEKIPALTSITPIPSYIVKSLAGRFDEPWMLRLPFLAVGLASILVFARAVREWHGREAAGWTAILLALSPFHVWYTTEARMYGALLLAAAMMYLYLGRAIRGTGRGAWIGYGAGALIGVYHHPFTWLLVGTHGLYLLIERRGMFRPLVVTAIVVAAATAPATWYVLVVHRLSSDRIGWIESRPAMAVAGTFYSFVMGLLFLPKLWWWALTGFAALLFGALTVRGAIAKRREALPVSMALVVPLFLVIAGSFVRDIYSDQTTRYLAFSEPFLILLAALGLGTIRSRGMRAAAGAGVVLVLLLALSPIHFLWDEVGTGRFEEAAEEIRTRILPGDVIISPSLVGLPVAYQLRGGLHREMRIGHSREVMAESHDSPRIWLLGMNHRSTRQFLWSPENIDLPASPAPEGYRLVDHQVFPGRKPISLTLYERAGGSGRR